MRVLLVPFKFGKTSNYFHFWVDFLIPLLLNGDIYSDLEICNEELGFFKNKNFVDLTRRFRFIGNEKLKEYEIRGMNPVFVEWGEKHFELINKIRSNYVENKGENDEVILIERKSDKRSIKNFEELLSKLRLRYLNIKRVSLEGCNFEKQVNIFYNAKLIIGQHGAGLTNILWCRPNTCIIEIDKNLGRSHFRNLSRYLNLRYYKYDALKKETKTLREKMKAEHLTVNCEDFCEFLESLNI